MDITGIVQDTSFYIVAFSITVMTLIFNAIDGHTDKGQNRVFMVILVDVILSSLSCVFSVGLNPYMKDSVIIYNVVFTAQVMYFVTHNALSTLFYMYVRKVSGIMSKSTVKKHVVELGPFIFIELLTLSNPFTKVIFYYNENGDFTRNWGESLIYITATGYLIAAIFNLLYYWYAINSRRRRSLVFSFALVITGIVIQMVFMRLQLELQFEALALLGIMFTIEKEDDRIDSVLRTYNRSALRMDMNNYFRMKKGFSVVCLRVEDTDYAKRAAFTTDPDVIMKPIADYLKSIHSKYQIYRTSAESFMLICSEPLELSVTIADRFKDSWRYEGGDVVLRYTILYADVPKELDSEESVMLLSDATITRSNEGRILSGEQLAVLTREGKINEAIKRSLALHNFDVFYQPVYRISDKKICFAEASVRLVDEEIGMVSASEFLPIARKQGVVGDIYYYLFEEMCIFLGSGIPVEMGLWGFSVSIPISLCLKDAFVTRIILLTEKYEVPTNTVNIRLTDTDPNDELDKLPGIVTKLKAAGFSVALQGAGEGFFRYCNSMDIDFDIMTLVIPHTGKYEQLDLYSVILKDFIGMVREMGKKTMIKGGTTTEGVDIIEKTGVDYLESIYYSHPVRQSEFISIIRMTEAARLDEQRAIAGSEAKSNFLANMSHEIRTPINAILGMNEMILRESSDPSILSYARDIESAGRSLVALINDILDFSKIEAGSIDISNASYNLAGLISDVCNMLRVKYASSALVFNVKVDPNLPKRLYGDEMRIRQVLLNLLNNAFKYTNEGSVSFTASMEQKGDEFTCIFDVTDTGIGIKEEDMDKLFGTFVRLEMERNKTVEGSGLGLAITKNLVEKMGGEVIVNSVYGKGSNFRIVLPQKVIDDTPIGNFGEMKNSEIPTLKHRRESFTAKDAVILVVDDTPVNLKVISRLLKRTGIQVDTAKSGEECLELCESKVYDIIFLDYRMPVMDGVETLHELKNRKGINEFTPIVVLTANALSGARERFISEGFDDYLSKPVESGYLEEVILKFLPDDKVTLINDGDEAPVEVFAEDDQAEDGFGLNLPELIAAGIDVEKGMLNCGENDAYRETLYDFAVAGLEGAGLLRDYLKTEDIKNITIRVHSIKSTSRLIGALDLSSDAEKLENAGEEEDFEFIHDKMPAFLVDLRSLCESILRVTGVPEEAEAGAADDRPGIDEGMLADAIGSLKDFAGKADYSNVKLVLDTLDDFKLPGDVADKITAVKKHAEGFMWEEVLNDLN